MCGLRQRPTKVIDELKSEPHKAAANGQPANDDETDGKVESSVRPRPNHPEEICGPLDLILAPRVTQYPRFNVMGVNIGFAVSPAKKNDGKQNEVQVNDQAVFDTRTLVVLEVPRAGTPVFRAYWGVENDLLGTAVGGSAVSWVCG